MLVAFLGGCVYAVIEEAPERVPLIGRNRRVLRVGAKAATPGIQSAASSVSPVRMRMTR